MKASLVLRYILEGRLNYNNFNQALMQSTGKDLNTRYVPSLICNPYKILNLKKESLKSMYPEGNADLQIDLVLYVASAKEQPNMRYFEVINRAKAESKIPTIQTVPILTVLTKYDLLTPEEITGLC